MKRFKAAVGWSALVLIFCASCSTAPSPGVRDADSLAHPMMAHHLPAPVQNGQAASMGAVAPSERLNLAIHLPLRNASELTRLLHDLYDPASANFHRYLSVAEFTDRFAPTPVDYAAVVVWARSNGFIVTTTPNRRFVAVEGSVETVNRAFHVTVNHYRHNHEARNFYSPDREPTVSGLSVPLLQVTGMNDYVMPHPMLRRAAYTTLAAGSGPSGEYLPSDLRAAYYGNGPLTGAGQSIGILSFDGYLAADVQLYYSKTGMSSSVPVNDVLVGGFSGACTAAGSPTNSTCDDGEQVLDIVNAIGMAPGIQQILFYEGSSDTEILNRMATDNTAKVLSSSWGWNPADAASDDPIFLEFAAQGQTFLSASGDSGEFNSSTYSFPAVDPNVTQVGGTQLTTTGPGGAWSMETAWPESGGGYVSGTPIPTWQQTSGVVTAANQASATLRNSPDVAAEANFDNPTVVNGSFVTGYGGTSFAAPRWAGFIALANEQAVAHGGATVGFVNPALYAVGTSSNYQAALHDITSGSNPPAAGAGSGFNAVAGYDLVTGWGSPRPGLIEVLAGTSAVGTTTAVAPATTPEPQPLASRVFMYPKHGQTAEQQSADRRTCEQWASYTSAQSATGANRSSEYQRALMACGEARGYAVR